MFWKALNAWLDRVPAMPALGVASFGYVFLRALNGWTVATCRSFGDVPAVLGIDLHGALLVGEIAGYFVVAAASSLVSPYYRRWVGCAAFVGLTTVGTAALLATMAGWLPLGAAGVAEFFGGVGHSVALLMWFELYGCLPTRCALVAYAGSFFLSFFLWTPGQTPNTVFTALLMAVGPFGSYAMLVAAFRRIPCDRDPQPALVGSGHVPWRLVAWVAAFGFSYGLGHSVTGEGFSTLLSRVGMAVPEMLILLGALFFSKVFDFKALYATTLPLMAVGLVLAVGFQGVPAVSQVLMSAADESYLVLAYALGWAIAYRQRCSSAFVCGLLCGMNLACTTAGMVIGDLAAQRGTALLVLGVIAVVSAVAATIGMARSAGYIDEYIQRAGRLPKTDDRLRGDWGLSSREMVVLSYMQRGCSASEIASELFLAPSTVRSHMTHIYQKMGVHSRGEMEVLLMEER